MNLIVIDRATNNELLSGYELRLTGWSEERYWAEAPSDRFCEYVDGEVILPSPVDISHQRVVGLLTALLRSFCRVRALGEVLNGPAAVRLRPGLAREPDIFVLAPEDAARARGSRIEACPRFALEVADEDSERRDLVTKAAEYAARGIPEYWTVVLRLQQVVVHRLGEGGAGYAPVVYTEGRPASTALPGFWIDVGWLRRAWETDELRCLKEILGVQAL